MMSRLATRVTMLTAAPYGAFGAKRPRPAVRGPLAPPAPARSYPAPALCSVVTPGWRFLRRRLACAEGDVPVVHIVIMGCGRVGSTLAHELERREHSVAVIDMNPDAFRRLGEHFRGRQITGLGFDRDTLVAADIEQADAFAEIGRAHV